MTINDLRAVVSSFQPDDDMKKRLEERIAHGKRESFAVKKKRRFLPIAAAAVMAVMMLGVTAYAVSPEIQKTIRKIVFSYDTETELSDGYNKLNELGSPIPEGLINFSAVGSAENAELTQLNAEITEDLTYVAENIAFRSNEAAILCAEYGNGFMFEENESCDIEIAPAKSSGEASSISVGYIYGGEAVELYSGKPNEEVLTVSFLAGKSGEYKFYILNCGNDYQFLDSVKVGNKKALEEYYQNIGDKTADVEQLGTSLITSEDEEFSEFAHGFRVRYLGAVNTGKFAEAIVECDIDGEVKPFEYTTTGFEPVYSEVYSGCSGGEKYTEDGKIYSTFELRSRETFEPGTTIKIKITQLDRMNSQGMHNVNTEITPEYEPTEKIDGEFEFEITLGEPLKSAVLDIAPTELRWSSPDMQKGDTPSEAHMEISGISYSPKGMDVKLRMLEDCHVYWKDGRNGANYWNSFFMFTYGFMGSEYNPIAFKMSDGTYKYPLFGMPESDYVNDFVCKDRNNPTEEEYKWITTNISTGEEPSTLSFMFYDLVNYSDVEAISFCGAEFPITTKDFGIPKEFLN